MTENCLKEENNEEEGKKEQMVEQEKNDGKRWKTMCGDWKKE